MAELALELNLKLQEETLLISMSTVDTTEWLLFIKASDSQGKVL